MHAVYTPAAPFQFDAKVWNSELHYVSIYTYCIKIYLTGSISRVIRMN